MTIHLPSLRRFSIVSLRCKDLLIDLGERSVREFELPLHIGKQLLIMAMNYLGAALVQLPPPKVAATSTNVSTISP